MTRFEPPIEICFVRRGSVREPSRLHNTILIVRHGPGRGRLAGYCEHVLDWLRVERPDLASRIRIHETGAGPVALDDVGAVFFWLADPLKIKYPDCYEEARAIQREAERRSLPMINRPTALAAYGKGFQTKRLREARVPTPHAISVDSPIDLAGCAERLGLPLLVRSDQSFSQEGTMVVRNKRDLKSLKKEDLPEQAVVTGLMDVRGPQSGYSTTDLWTRFYHRKRVLLIGDQCVPDSLYFARTPLVMQSTSLYGEYHLWQTRLRRYGWLGKRAHRVLSRRIPVRRAAELESEFTAAPLDGEDVFIRAGAALDLEFLAFDFASLPNGDIVIWEANPYPYIPAARGNTIAQWRNSQAKVRNIYLTFSRCFESLLGSAPQL